MNKWVTSLRIQTWWSHLILPLTFWIYVVAYSRFGVGLEFAVFSVTIVLASTTLAGFGYLLNDWFDRNSDRRASKPNIFNFNFTIASVLFLVLSIATVISWGALQPSGITTLFLGGEVIVLVAYSCPPFRFKTKALGVVLDAMYSRVLPMLVVVSFGWVFNETLVLISVGWMFIVGIRNIIIHQIEDFENDFHSGNETFVGRIGRKTAERWILRLLLPLEVIFASMVLIMLSDQFSFLYLSLPLYSGYLCLRFKVWKPESRLISEWSKRFLFVPNDFVSDVLPLAVLLVIFDGSLINLVVVIIHLTLFYTSFLKYLIQLRELVRDFLSWLPGYLIRVRLFFSFWVNRFLVKLFLLFGVDLVKERLSIAGYFRKRLTKNRKK